MWKALFVATLMALPMAAQAGPHRHKAPEDTVIVVTPIAALPMHIGGRVAKDAAGYAYQWPGVYFETRFTGPSVSMDFDDDANNFNVILDGKPVMVVHKPGHRMIDIEIGGSVAHDIRLEKRSETQYAVGHFIGFRAMPAASAPARARQIEFIGDSLTVGYGNTSAFKDCTPDDIFETTDAQEGFGPLTAKHFDADYQINAFSGRGIVRNYNGFAGDSLPQLYAYTVFDGQTKYVKPDWLQPQIIVIALGTNDFSPGDSEREKMTVEAYTAAYIDFVSKLRGYYPDAHVFGVSSPMLGDAWPEPTDTSASDLKSSLAAMVEHFSEAGDDRVHQINVTKVIGTGCGTHPSVAQHASMAAEVADAVKTTLGW